MLYYHELKRLHNSNPADYFGDARLLYPAKVIVIRLQSETISSKVILEPLQCKILFEGVPSRCCITELL
jgi:hypothetical protein